jgi:8-oxo-dGTP pyrophosphatase MutT (NUDIX family)
VNTTWIDWLRRRLANPLPDRAAKTRFEPTPSRWDHDAPAPADARRASVLALLYPVDGELYLPLTLRPEHLPAHGGQVSLPGGEIEPGETARQAAPREFHEELGAQGQAIDVLGPLTPIYVAASRFSIEPYLATSASRPAFEPNPAEVAELLEVPLTHLFDQGNFGSHRRQARGQECAAPHFAFGLHRIWGATCRILGELLVLWEEYRCTACDASNQPE